MTFLEAALEILKRERKPLHYKDLAERAMSRKLLTFVGRTPEMTMQAQLTNAVKKAPGSPFVRVKPGIFGLLRYPEGSPEPEPDPEPEPQAVAAPGQGETQGGGEHRRRRRRGGRGGHGDRPDMSAEGAQRSGGEMTTNDTDDEDRDAAIGSEPEVGSLSPEARAAALAEAGVQGQGEDEDGDEGLEDDDGPPGEEEDGSEASGDPADAVPSGFEEGAGGRRRRRRRRRRHGADNGAPEAVTSPGAEAPAGAGVAAGEGAGVQAEGTAAPSGALEGQALEPAHGASAETGTGGRRIMSPVDAAIEVLKGQAPGRGVHVRQIADAAVRRRLVHGEPNEAWRVMRAALAAEPRERLRQGLRPRVRAAGSGLYALSRRPPDMDLERAEHVFGEARRALRERTLASLEQRLVELSPSAFEAIARVLLQREGLGPATFVKRVEGGIYLEALRGRGARPSRCLIGLRPGPTPAGRRAIGELRAGIRARGQDEGLLILAARLAEDAVAEWRQSGTPVEVIDGATMAESCARHGVGVQSATVNVDLVDADFFAELSEG